jgi:hypothetical protein
VNGLKSWPDVGRLENTSRRCEVPTATTRKEAVLRTAERCGAAAYLEIAGAEKRYEEGNNDKELYS